VTIGQLIGLLSKADPNALLLPGKYKQVLIDSVAFRLSCEGDMFLDLELTIDLKQKFEPDYRSIGE